jgi:hypothetical protein
MGGKQSFDNAWDVYAMSDYNTITSLAESPLQEGLIYAGTDDGIIQVTEDGGANWRRIEAGQLPGVPRRAFVNDIKADLFDANTVYVALDDHKNGDFKPYLYKSTDQGRTWKSISEGIGERTLVWRVVQDHVDMNLLFAATEFGIYFSQNGGDKWIQLKGGLPTISFRDLVIQKRENDLVCASFGRSFYVLDDYSALRNITEEQLMTEAILFPTRKAYAYNPRMVVGSQGAQRYVAKNPDFGAVFTYYLGKMKEEKKDIAFAGWDVLEDELNEDKTKLWLTIKNGSGEVISKLKAKAGKGFHRIAWNLRYPSKRSIRLGQKSIENNRWSRNAFVEPGTYTAYLSKEEKGQVTKLTNEISFEVAPLRKGALEGASPEEIVAYKESVEALASSYSAMISMLKKQRQKSTAFALALEGANIEPGLLNGRIYELKQELNTIESILRGNKARNEIGEKNPASIGDRIGTARRGLYTTYGPTPLHKMSLEIAKEEMAGLIERVERLENDVIPSIEKELAQHGAPWIEGQPIPKERD